MIKVMQGLPSWLKPVEGGFELTLYIQPGAKRSAVLGEHDGALKISIHAPPVDGKANASVLAFVAERCNTAKSKVSLLSGETSRRKRVRVLGVDEGAAANFFAE